MNDLLTMPEVVALGIAERTLKRWAATGRLVPEVRGRGNTRNLWRRKAVEYAIGHRPPQGGARWPQSKDPTRNANTAT